MVFKEKLIKTHHKRAYYRARQFLMAFLIIASAGIAITVPTYISLNIDNEPVNSKAEGLNEDVSEEVDSPSLLNLLHY